MTPETVTHWGAIPAMVTTAFKEFELTTLPPAQRTAVFHSSGTTQQRPSRHFHSALTLELYEQSLLAGFKPRLLPDLDRTEFLLLSPPAAVVPNSSLAHMFDCVSRQWSVSGGWFAGTVAEDKSWSLDFEMLAAGQANEARSPVIICGTAFSFVHWCDHLAGRKQRASFPPGSRVLETGGYKGRSRVVPKEELHRMIEKHLGIPPEFIVSEYGMSELSSQGYDRTAGRSEPRLLHFAPWARARVISPETLEEAGDGETGLVRVWDPANVGSVMAVQTEDLAVKRGEGFELIGRAPLAEPRGCSLLEIRS